MKMKMKMTTKIQRLPVRVLKKLSRMLGYDMQRARTLPEDPFEAQRALLDRAGVDRPIIFDIGANRGLTALRYRTVFPESALYCFEPSLSAFEILNNTFGTDEHVTLVRTAVGDKDGKARLFLYEEDVWNSLLPRPRATRRYYSKRSDLRSTSDVPVVTIDHFVQQEGIGEIHILKLDIQGCELMALRGATRTLEQGRASLIFTETMFVPHYEGQPLFHQLCEFLSDYQYSLYDIYDLHRGTNGQLRYCDALFVNARVRTDVIDRCKEEP